MRIITGNKGQIALVVLVISAIVMTVGLSVSKKSVVETKITTDEELLKQAFNAAESGIDYYLGTGMKNFTAPNSQSEAEVEVNSVGGGTSLVDLGVVTLRNDVAFTWLVGHSADGAVDLAQRFLGTGLTLCVDSAFSGALKVDYFYYRNAGTNYEVRRSGYNVRSSLVLNYELLMNPIPACPGIDNTSMISLNIPMDPAKLTPLLLAVKPIGGDTKVRVMATGGEFPSQGEEIRSSGSAGDISGGTNAKVNRNVRVINQYFLPPFMLDAITAAGDVTAL